MEIHGFGSDASGMTPGPPGALRDPGHLAISVIPQDPAGRPQDARETLPGPAGPPQDTA